MIEISNITKRFGALTAVDDVSFNVGRGEVLGFLGPNGAGKSTTMKMVTGLPDPRPGHDPNRWNGHRGQSRGGQALDRLPAGGGTPLRRDDHPRVSAVHRGNTRVQGRGSGAPHRRRGRDGQPGIRPPHADRHAVEGIQAAGRARPGRPPRPANPRPRRTHRRPRSEPEARGARPHSRHVGGEGDRPLPRTSSKRWMRYARGRRSSRTAVS